MEIEVKKESFSLAALFSRICLVAAILGVLMQVYLGPSVIGAIVAAAALIVGAIATTKAGRVYTVKKYTIHLRDPGASREEDSD